VIERAGVAKATLYSVFGSKDELIRAYLTARHVARQERLRNGLARYHTPRERLLGVFDVLGELIALPGFRGCAFLSASAEASAGSAVEEVSGQSRTWVRSLFTELSQAAGAADPEHLAQQLVLLYDGATVAARMDHGPGCGRCGARGRHGAARRGHRARPRLAGRQSSDQGLDLGGQLAAPIAGVDHAARLEQHQGRLDLRARAVLDTARHDEQLPGPEHDIAVPQLNRQLPVEDQEKLVGVGVLMPGELALDLHEPHVVIVNLGDLLRRPVLSNACQHCVDAYRVHVPSLHIWQ
jgi:AcrR family transcriptional regulator